MEKAWVIQDADRHFYRLGIRRATEGLPFADQKNPATAYTLSLFFCGAGQSYSGRRMKGVLFQVFMLLFLMGTAVLLLFGESLLALLHSYGVGPAEAFLAAEILLFCALVFWSYNAADAYDAAVKTRRVPFQGVRSRALPLICSLLVPGWGQYLNGQPRKGALLSILAVLAIFSLLTVPAVLFLWPELEPSRARAILESIFAATVLYAPFVPVIALLSSYDALKVSMDDVKKESLLDRVMLTVSRIRIEGWMRSLLPTTRSALALALLLGLVLFFKDRAPDPARYYNAQLIGARTWLEERGMTIVPGFIGKMVSGTTAGHEERET